MTDHDPSSYGESIAGRYDEWFPDAEPAMIDRLAALAGKGKALELGIGTGRVALPLRERGVEVHGIDASESMIERLRTKPGGASIPVTIGTFAAFESEHRFELVFVVFNTLFALLTQEEQLACFRSVSAVLAQGGRFVVEAFVPDLDRFDRGQAVRAVEVAAGHVRLECSLHDRAAQRVTSQILDLASQGIRMQPIHIRYAWPSELDLMARLAGLALVERHGGWNAEPFTADSTGHVSIYGGSDR